MSPQLGLVHPQQDPLKETDAMLVEAVRRQDIGAAARLYDRHAASVHGMAYRLLGPEAELDDVVQEVFIYALASMGKLREPGALKGWLLGIAVGKVRAHLRARWRRRWLSFLPNDELPEPTQASADEDADVVHEVGAILNLLPAEECVALVVHRLEGLSIQEAARTCGLTLSTFKRRFARAETKFISRAMQRPVLAKWVERSGT